VSALALAGVLVLVGVLAGALAVVLGACIVAGRTDRNASGLGSDEEWARELLGYQASHWPMHRRNGGERPEDPVA
jgi:hypothetical protein